ncbi:hypothetical protein CONPUDRAFT_121609 [Coniophora puteana RWD-64-598 SS2]|uniref:GmrSD restriction endonucleases N-terminal domain-containing protein n=1 Tax=Coniophora puteana (strain RWD-64-598) TaxID=741705 RepID=A0A5M3MVG6_CONPW|nr:uncharacterized protein CONPUDRAFT_121609 [Coniophora puteana RWD-64-598 SS2]EIW83162.1 hypothetical protein CONPUDRAFT_121609 [Coniophora puteana RWD-64-598 SS2]
MSQDPDKEYDELEDDFDSEAEDPNAFKITNCLTPPSARIYTAQELHSLIHQGLIDLNPAYQRDVVWPESKQIGLIDSIFRNFYVPPVIFAVQRDDEGEEVRICVDGKQRLTSIQKFFDGLIPHRESQRKKSFWYTRSENQKATRPEIPDFWKKKFAGTQITCVEYYGIAPGTEREIFQRVQLGMSLTAAEKLQAISSPWAEWISDLEARHVSGPPDGGGLSEVLAWDTKRGRDFQCIAQLVYCCDGLPEKFLPTAQKLERWLSRIDKPLPAFRQQMNEVLTEFWLLATSPNLQHAFTQVDKRVAPVEFVFIGVLLHVLRHESQEARAKAVLRMRLRIREQFHDVRNNTTVGKALWAFIDSVTGPAGLKVLDRGNGYPMDIEPTPSAKGRKRRQRDHEEEDEYRPSPIKSLGKAATTRSQRK